MTRVVLVIGASSGVGRAAAHLLAEAGDHLVLVARSEQALQDTAAECTRRGASSAEVLPVDVRDREGVEALVASVVREHGRIDAALHVAGVVAFGRFEDIPAEVFDGVIETNLLGPANIARAVLPVLREQQQGHLVLVGSLLGEVAAPGMTPYVVSKWGVRSLGRQLAIENRDVAGVHVSVVSPGPVDTPIYRKGAHFQDHPGRAPAPVEGSQRVAQAVVDVLDSPRDRVSVGLLNPLVRWAFQLVPGVFDAVVGPVLDLLATRPGPQPDTSGNVLEPLDGADEVDGDEGQALADAAARAGGR